VGQHQIRCINEIKRYSDTVSVCALVGFRVKIMLERERGKVKQGLGGARFPHVFGQQEGVCVSVCACL
jgi:hypothetical protein